MPKSCTKSGTLPPCRSLVNLVYPGLTFKCTLEIFYRDAHSAGFFHQDFFIKMLRLADLENSRNFVFNKGFMKRKQNWIKKNCIHKIQRDETWRSLSSISQIWGTNRNFCIFEKLFLLAYNNRVKKHRELTKVELWNQIGRRIMNPHQHFKTPVLSNCHTTIRQLWGNREWKSMWKFRNRLTRNQNCNNFIFNIWWLSNNYHNWKFRFEIRRPTKQNSFQTESSYKIFIKLEWC